MNNIVCQPPITAGKIFIDWTVKKVKMYKLKNKIAESVKNNQFADVRKYVDELEKLEKESLIKVYQYYIIH